MTQMRIVPKSVTNIIAEAKEFFRTGAERDISIKKYILQQITSHISTPKIESFKTEAKKIAKRKRFKEFVETQFKKEGFSLHLFSFNRIDFQEKLLQIFTKNLSVFKKYCTDQTIDDLNLCQVVFPYAIKLLASDEENFNDLNNCFPKLMHFDYEIKKCNLDAKKEQERAATVFRPCPVINFVDEDFPHYDANRVGNSKQYIMGRVPGDNKLTPNENMLAELFHSTLFNANPITQFAVFGYWELITLLEKIQLSDRFKLKVVSTTKMASVSHDVAEMQLEVTEIKSGNKRECFIGFFPESRSTNHCLELSEQQFNLMKKFFMTDQQIVFLDRTGYAEAAIAVLSILIAKNGSKIFKKEVEDVASSEIVNLFLTIKQARPCAIQFVEQVESAIICGLSFYENQVYMGNERSSPIGVEQKSAQKLTGSTTVINKELSEKKSVTADFPKSDLVHLQSSTPRSVMLRNSSSSSSEAQSDSLRMASAPANLDANKQFIKKSDQPKPHSSSIFTKLNDFGDSVRKLGKAVSQVAVGAVKFANEVVETTKATNST